MDQFWSAVIIAIVSAIPPTLMGLATLIYVIKTKAENKIGNDKIESKVDAVKKEVDGKHSELITAIRDIATAATNKTVEVIHSPDRRKE
jgi:hypothetical protein